MINKIIDGISISLDAEFGKGYKIYTELVEQGLKKPCFSILCVNPTNNLFRGKRYFRQNLMCVQYFPSTRDVQAECFGVLEKLYGCLETIYVGDDPQSGTSMHGEIVDGVLNFFVNYDMFVDKVVQTEVGMETFSVETDVKG